MKSFFGKTLIGLGISVGIAVVLVSLIVFLMDSIYGKSLSGHAIS